MLQDSRGTCKLHAGQSKEGMKRGAVFLPDKALPTQLLSKNTFMQSRSRTTCEMTADVVQEQSVKPHSLIKNYFSVKFFTLIGL